VSGAFLRALMLGSGRNELQPPPAMRSLREARGDRWLLSAVALLGQQLRHRREPVPAIDERAGLPRDERPTVCERSRALMVSLFSNRSGELPTAALAARFAMRAAGRRAHPFDLPKLPAWLGVDADLLDPQEVAWLGRGKAGDDEPVDGERMTADTWHEYPLAMRASFLARERVRDPAGARDMLAASLDAQPAATRCRLLECLAIGLSADDRELLEQQHAGRAESVRTVAAGLLARLPGTEQHGGKLDELTRDIVVGKAGVLRRKRTFAWRKASTDRADRVQEALDALVGVDLDALARRLGVDRDALVDGAAGDGALATGLLAAAVSTGRGDVVALARRLPEAEWSRVLDMLGQHPQRAELARGLVEACMQPQTWRTPPTPYALLQLLSSLEGPLPQRTAAALLAGEWLRRMLGTIAKSPLEASERFVLEPIAALLPAPHRSEYRARIEPIALADRQRAGLLLDLLDLLDPHEPR